MARIDGEKKLSAPEVEYADEDGEFDPDGPPPFDPEALKPKKRRVITMQEALRLKSERANR